MDKVKLPKEVAQAIEELRMPHNGFSNYAIIGMLHDSTRYAIPQLKVLDNHMGQDKMHPDELIRALVNGYEVEETPEDKVRDIYERGLKFHKEWHNPAVKVAVEEVLEALNIKIKGVND